MHFFLNLKVTCLYVKVLLSSKTDCSMYVAVELMVVLLSRIRQLGEDSLDEGWVCLKVSFVKDDQRSVLFGN
jgi:hypothetical protein